MGFERGCSRLRSHRYVRSAFQAEATPFVSQRSIGFFAGNPFDPLRRMPDAAVGAWLEVCPERCCEE